MTEADLPARPPPRRPRSPFALAALLLASAASPALAQADVEGQWTPTVDWPMVAIHAAVLPDGKVMTMGSTPQGNQGGFDFDVWDPKRGLGADAHVTKPNVVNMDSFCAATVLQAWNGQLMIVGGGTANQDDTFKTGRFSWKSQTLEMGERARYPRWYATTTTLPDGRILMQGGGPAYANHTNSSDVAEIYTPGQGWRTLQATFVQRADNGGGEERWYYPRMWPVPGNKAVVIAGKVIYELGYDGNGSIGNVQAFNRPNWGATSTAVMYAPKKVLQVGGGGPVADVEAPAGSKAASTIDLSRRPYAVADATPMRFGRHWPTASVLPNGEVLVIGGSEGNNGWNYRAETAALHAEMWNPATGRWRTLARSTTPRLYHSASLLLPDGRVFSGGGGVPGPVYGKSAEVFSPPYLFGPDGKPAPRPVIAGEPGIVRLGQTFEVRATGSRPISRFTVVKTGAVTHGLNMDQRFLELPFSGGDGVFRVSMTADPIDATPGYYMLFALDDRGVPSVAKMLRVPSPLGDNGEAPPASAAEPGQTDLLAWAKCADENGTCAVPDPAAGPALVRYGVEGAWTRPRSVTAGIACTNAVFGDPVPGTIKTCQAARAGGATPTTPNTPTTPADSAVAGLPPAAPAPLVAAHSKLCLSVKGGSLADGADLVQEACRAGAAVQSWAWQPANGGYMLVNGQSKKCVDVFDFNRADGTRLVQWGCHGGDNQVWTARATPAGPAIVSKMTDKCMDVAGISTAPGAQVWQWSCLNAANQAWSAGGAGSDQPPAPPAQPPIVAAHSKLCLSVKGGSGADGAELIQETCRPGAAIQGWTWRKANGGYLLVNNQSNKCVDLLDGRRTDGAKLGLWTCNGNAVQVWTPRRTQAGTALVSAFSGKCMDVAGVSAAPGAQVWQWSCLNAANQAWTLGNGAAIPTN